MADGTGAVRATERTFVDVELAELFPMATNPRRLPTDPAQRAAKVADIVATIRVDEGGYPLIVDGKPRGIREPLCIRKRTDGGHDIIKGERRFRAAQIVGLRRLTCEVVEMTDEQVLEEQLVEDGARVDLTPLEEAAALVRLREEYSLDVAAIADRTGKTPRLVRQRLALHDALVDEAKAALAAGKITLGLAEDLAALGRAPQLEALTEILHRWCPGEDAVGRKDAKWDIDRRKLRLADGGFPIDDAELVPAAGSCLACPKRSGAQAELWADGVQDKDQCTDAACFKSKREGQATRVRERAKASGTPIADKPAEVKKIFPYGGSLPHGSPFVDLAAPCELVRPPAAPRVEPRRGGAEKCPDPNYAGEHDWTLESTRAQRPEHDAAKAGLDAWAECNGEGCDAWEDIEDDDQVRGAPKGWKPPTWGEVLGKALAQAGTEAATVKPSLVAKDGDGRVHELVDKKEALKAATKAGLIGEKEAKNEIRDHRPAAPKKNPGELEAYQIKHQAEEQAKNEALAQIAEKAGRRKADEKFWRFLAGLVVRTVSAMGEPEEQALERRGLKPEKKGADLRKELLERVMKGASEGECRGLCIELLGAADDTGQDDEVFAVACRFYDIDIAELEKEATKKIKAEQKTKAQGKPAKPATKGKATKPAAASAKLGDPCPLTASDVLALAVRRKIKVHPGANSPDAVWHLIQKIRAAVESAPPGVLGSARANFHKAYESAGTGAVDLALLYLCDKGVLLSTGGKGAKENFQRVSLEGKGAPPKVVEKGQAVAGTCRICKCQDAKACAGGCAWTDDTETLCSTCAELREAIVDFIGQGKVARDVIVNTLDPQFAEEDWYTPKRLADALADLVEVDVLQLWPGDVYALFQVGTKPPRPGPGMLARGPGSVGKPPPEIVAVVRDAAEGYRTKIREYVITYFAKGTQVAPAVLHAAIANTFHGDAWYGGPLGAQVEKEAIGQLLDRGAIELRDGCYRQLDPRRVPCSACKAPQNDACNGHPALPAGGEYHPSRIVDAKRQLGLPTLDPKLVTNVLAACKTARLGVQVHKACKGWKSQDIDAAISAMLEDGRLEREKGTAELVAAKAKA